MLRPSLPLAILASLLVLSGSGIAEEEKKSAPADRKPPPLLIQTEELARLLAETSPEKSPPILLDCRSGKDHGEGHLPGAVPVDVRRWTGLASRPGGLTDEKLWSEEVGRLGIDGRRPVVVYGDSLTTTARAWWLLRYVGVPDVRLLDGGWTRWKAQELPVDRGPVTPGKVKFRARFQADRLATREQILESLRTGSCTLVDTRSESEHGLHIPGSVHLEWKELLASDGRFKKPAGLRQIFLARGLKPGKPLVPY